MDGRTLRGFTLVELLIALTLAAILSVAGHSALSSFYTRQKQVTTTCHD